MNLIAQPNGNKKKFNDALTSFSNDNSAYAKAVHKYFVTKSNILNGYYEWFFERRTPSKYDPFFKKQWNEHRKKMNEDSKLGYYKLNNSNAYSACRKELNPIKNDLKKKYYNRERSYQKLKEALQGDESNAKNWTEGIPAFDKRKYARFRLLLMETPMGGYPANIGGFLAKKLGNEANISPERLGELFCRKTDIEFVNFLAFENPDSLRADCIRPSEAIYIHKKLAELYASL